MNAAENYLVNMIFQTKGEAIPELPFLNLFQK
jgi:hypothetical protein